MIIQEPVQATIWFTLNHYSYKDAIFLAERLNAEVGSEESLYLLATCYYRAGKQMSAYSILSNKTFKSADCRLLLARCCCDLKKFDEAEEALVGKLSCFETNRSRIVMSLDDLISEFGKSASFAAQLLAYVCSKTERYDLAIQYYEKSLKVNPFLWSSFENLIQLGEKPNSSKIFNIKNVDFSLCLGNNPLVNLWNNCVTSSKTCDSSQVTGFNGSMVQASATTTTPSATALPATVATVSKELNQSVEIHSPFAVIKSGHDNNGTGGSIDVITPDKNSWLTTNLVSNRTNVMTEKNLGMKKNSSIAASTVDRIIGHSGDVKVVSTPIGRLKFGVFPIGDTPTFYQSSNSITGGGNAGTELNERTPAVTGNKGITRAPMKKPPTRKTGQQLHAPTTRNNIHKPIFSQSVNINSQQGGEFQAPAAVSNQSSVPTSLGLRRSSRIFNSSSSVKENSKASSRTVNQENNKRPTSSITPASKKMRKQNAQVAANSSAQKEKELNELNKPESKTGVFNNSTALCGEDIKQTGLKMQRASAEGLLDLLKELGTAALYLGQFHCQKAIKLLMNLPQKHFNTGYVLTAIGRAYFEMAKYEEAVKYFEDAHRNEPHRLQGTEYYSTALWHLQREVRLSMLAQEMIEFDKNAPQTWCVAGNCFGLQKEHETAIKFLQRAIQVDPEFAYAYTLLGHELVMTEEMDHAMACFRNAIRIDTRHYNAWYGIGMIYYKQEKYQMAELHYRKALQITSCSPVLLCHVGVVQVALKKTESALQTLNRALELDPKNALCKFHRASIYFNLDKHLVALSELEELKKIVPKESLVYFLIGKVHKRLGNTHLALMNFSWAMDLDPKGHNNQIKGVIDKQSNDDDEVVFIDSNDEGQSSNNIADSSESSVRGAQSHPESNSSVTEEDDSEDEDEDRSDAADEIMDLGDDAPDL